MKLENLRDDDIGTVSAWLPEFGNGPESKTHLTFPQFTQLAFYYTAQQIEQLESSYPAIKQGNSIQTTVGLWFISIEAYINSILRIACLAKGKSFEEHRTQDFGARLKSLFAILCLEKTPFYKGPFQRLEEFKRYRNELFHDRTNDQRLEFQKTLFSGNPMYANQVDIMQASVIALEVYEAFRYVIPDIDLMPQIMVIKESSFFYSPFDRLYNEVLRPYFESSLSKHSLTSSLDLNIQKVELGVSSTFKSTPIRIIVKAQPEPKYEHRASKEKTNFGFTLFEKIRAEVIFDTERDFKTANYYRA